MRFPSKEIVESIRREYPAGTRVELVQMDDVQASFSETTQKNHPGHNQFL